MADNRPTFEDALQLDWQPELTSPALIGAAREYGISVADLIDAEKINIGALAGLLWYSCKEQADKRGISQDEFFGSRVPPSLMMGKALETLFESIQQSMPAEEGEGEENAPLADTESRAAPPKTQDSKSDQKTRAG